MTAKHNPFDLTGRVALITGAYRGLGFAIARGLAAGGARVILNGRNADALAGASAVLAGEDLHVDVALFDVTDADAVREGVASAARSVGPIDILVNNAGIQRRHALVDFPQRDWDEIIATNLTAPYVVSQAVLPAMIARGSGKIIHIASLMSEFARPSVVPYTAAKGGIRQLTRGMAVELAPHGIHVNGIAPTVVLTEAAEKWRTDPARWEAFLARVPLRRAAEPRDIVGATLFFCSSASDFVTGQVLYVDGGITASQ